MSASPTVYCTLFNLSISRMFTANMLFVVYGVESYKNNKKQRFVVDMYNQCRPFFIFGTKV